MAYVVEVCCFTIEDVIMAQKAGAQRVELCSDRAAGGTTPSYGLMEQVIETISVDLAVIIRPRGGDSLYSPEELAVMERDIKIAGNLGAKAVVFGVIDETAFIDVAAMARLVDLAKSYNMEAVCHRAFDRARNPHEFLEELLKLGVDRLLTSGQQPTATQGIPLLKELTAIAGDELAIMPGGGIRGNNFHPLLDLDIKDIHTGTSKTVKSTVQTYQGNVHMGSPRQDEDERLVVDEKDVAVMVKAMAAKAKNKGL